MNEAHATGMLIGAYHYANPDLGNDAADEARYFVSVAGKYLKEGYLRPVLDLEEGASLGKAALSNWVHEWLNTVKSDTGIEPIIYVNSNYANNYLDNDWDFCSTIAPIHVE
jgi:lysozyme